MLLSWYSYFRFYFSHNQTHSSIIQEHTNIYSESCRSLAYSEPWHIPITKHIQTPRYIHNTMLNIFAKALVVCIRANQHDNSLTHFFTLINTLLIGNIAFFKFITQTLFLHLLIEKKPLKIGIQRNNLHIFL